MLLHQYNRLTESAQYRHLILNGTCIAERSTGDEDCLLFQVQDFYVEVFFLRYTDHITGLQCFRDTNALAPYLEDISVTHLLS